ncbi:MAG: site-2 protease family protein [Deltaproteobacteria bacterium]|nr:site-2 protease family protein [Deltaproteobacteria bacterium]
MGRGWRLGRIWGVEVRLDWGLFVVFWLLTFNLGAGVLPQWHPEWSPALTWTIAVIASVLFFASILAHELSHALVGRAQGIQVDSITLFIFGGVANLQSEPASPRAELLMAVVGPVTSIALGILFVLLGVAWTPVAVLPRGAQAIQVVRAAGPAATVLLWLGPINIVLGLFNLVPAFPLDGGRVLRALLWLATKSLRRAMLWATRLGQLFAWLLIFSGIAMIFGGRVPLLGGGVVQGLWLTFIGWFLNSAAVMSWERLVVRDSLANVPVSRVMRPEVVSVGPEITVEALVTSYVLGTDQRAFPVLEADSLVGIVTLSDVRRVPQDAWAATTVRQIMTAADELSVVRPSEGAAEALQKLTRRDIDQVPVVEEGHLVGILRRRDIMKWLELQTAT